MIDIQQTSERQRRIKECVHEHTRGEVGGYVLCEDCGALLPDEDPDLQTKIVK